MPSSQSLMVLLVGGLVLVLERVLVAVLVVVAVVVVAGTEVAKNAEVAEVEEVLLAPWSRFVLQPASTSPSHQYALSQSLLAATGVARASPVSCLRPC